MNLRSVEYDRIDSGEHQIGVIAQEVEKIIPQVVGTWKLNDELTDARSLEYQRLVPYLIEAIKEQQKQIDQLKSDVKTLMNK